MAEVCKVSHEKQIRFLLTQEENPNYSKISRETHGLFNRKTIQRIHSKMLMEEKQQHIKYFNNLNQEEQKDLFNMFILNSKLNHWQVINSKNGSIINIIRVPTMFKRREDTSSFSKELWNLFRINAPMNIILDFILTLFGTYERAVFLMVGFFNLIFPDLLKTSINFFNLCHLPSPFSVPETLSLGQCQI